MKRLLLCIIIGLVLGISIQQSIDHYSDAELVFFNQVAEKTDSWYRETRGQKPVYVIIGGSEIATSVDPMAFMKQHGLAVINAGNHAGFGMPGNFVAAEHYISQGCHVICSLFPSPEVTTQGIKFAFRRRGGDLFSSGIIPLTCENLLKLAVGDLSSNIKYIKRLRKKRPYVHAYANPKNACLHDTGFLEIHSRRMQEKAYPPKRKADYDFNSITALCKKMQLLCEERNAKFSVMLAHQYFAAEDRLKNAEIALHLTQNNIRVLKDERLGVSQDLSDFADTPSHLSRKGVDSSTIIWSDALKNDAFWSEQELQKIIAAMNAE